MFQFQTSSVQILEPFSQRIETASVQDQYHYHNFESHLDQKSTSRSLKYVKANGWESPGTESFQKGR